MIFGSVCSGIEAASVAWKPLGWTPAFFSEIEPFPCELLRQRHPDAPNLGDLARFSEWPDYAIDVLIGGTPCQAFSVAGLRKGLADPRGNLTLTYLGVVDRYRPEWVIWENVPGVLSDKTGAFGAFLGGLAQLGYGFAYRVLDAQYYGLAQRRRRVFVVGHIRDWRRAAAVLFERESLQWDTAPRREARQTVTGTLSARASAGGGLGTDFDCQGGITLARCDTTGEGSRLDGETCTFVTAAIQSVNTPREKKQNGIGVSEGDTMYTLTNRDQHAVAFSVKDYGADASENLSPTLRAGVHSKSHANGGVMPAIAFTQNQRNEVRELSVAGCQSAIRRGDAKNETLLAVGSCEIAGTLRSNMGSGFRSNGTPVDCDALNRSAVRRLTPRECERLQGFPDDYTLIEIGKKRKPAADGPRYRALGNSMATPVISWIGRKIISANNC